MTHFRFRYKQVGCLRWRCRAARRRTMLFVLPLNATPGRPASAAAWRRTVPVSVPITPIATVLQIGSFVVGPEGDPQLMGHPDIRY